MYNFSRPTLAFFPSAAMGLNVLCEGGSLIFLFMI